MKKMMLVFTFFLALVLIFGSGLSAKMIRIGEHQIVAHPALDNDSKGFAAALAEEVGPAGDRRIGDQGVGGQAGADAGGVDDEGVPGKAPLRGARHRYGRLVRSGVGTGRLYQRDCRTSGPHDPRLLAETDRKPAGRADRAVHHGQGIRRPRLRSGQCHRRRPS